LGYSIETYAGDLAALLDTLGIEDAVLCGLSMGGYVALEFVRRWRKRVRALVLMDTRAEADSADARRARDTAAATAREEGAAAVADALLPRMLSRGTHADSPETTEEVRRMMAATPVAGMVGALGAMRDRADSTELLPGLAGLPTLVIVGADDVLTPPTEAQAIAAAVPGARLSVIAGAGHLPPVERPAETTAALREFLEGLP
jgi:pimeloyl-ACP methyl ester carboxylesterase